MSSPDPFRSDGPPAEEQHPASNGHHPTGLASDAWMDARVEPYVDALLSPAERDAFEARLRNAPRWQSAVRRARRVQAGLRALAQPSCPPAITQAVVRKARAGRPSPYPDRPATSPRAAEADSRAADRPRAWQPPLALALLLLLAAAVALLGQPTAPASNDRARTFTHAEVQRATAEAEWTLAFLAQVTRETGATVHEDVLLNRVARPTRQATLQALHHLSPDDPAPSPVHDNR